MTPERSGVLGRAFPFGTPKVIEFEKSFARRLRVEEDAPFLSGVYVQLVEKRTREALRLAAVISRSVRRIGNHGIAKLVERRVSHDGYFGMGAASLLSVAPAFRNAP
jgi:hypothetical protein